MFKNYFYIFRSVIELQPKLNGCIINDIYSQEKNKLFFHVPTDKYPHRHLIISVNPQFPFLLLKDEHHKAKRNTVHFFQEKLPAQISNIEISNSDRIVRIISNHFNLYLIVRGGKTNVIIIDKTYNVNSFKKMTENITEELSNTIFINEPQKLKIANDENEYLNVNELKSVYPMIPSEIKNELLHRSTSDNFINFNNSFKRIITEILHNRIKVGFNEDLNKLVFIPDSFKTLLTINSKTFEYFNDALQFYLSNYYKGQRKNNYEKDLNKFFEKELSALSSKLNKLKQRIDIGSKEQIYYRFGNMLLTNIYKLKKGMDSIEINSLDDNEIEKIKLDSKLSSKQNIDKYFEKAKDEKVNYNKSVELFNFTKKKYEDLLNDFKKFENSDSTEEIIALHKKLIKQNEKIIKMDTGHKFKYWHYLIEDKYHLYVGRDSKSNDYLSIKFAKQNDYWFHARGLPGSHVVLRVENTKIGVPKDIIKKGAAIAAYYSKAKTAGTASVSYTLAKFVHKKKGMAPGKVLLSKENTLLVRPGIPKNCELISE